MIYYSGGWNSVHQRVFKCHGSLLPKSFIIAIFPAFIAGVLQFQFPNGTLGFFEGDSGILRETQAWSGFSFLVGFLIVFRTGQAYNRFWEGCTASHQMRAEWFDACSSIVSFTKHSKAHVEKIRRFKELLIRLTSMLHAAALAELEKGEQETEELWAHHYELIDPESMDSESLETIKEAEDRVELIFEWIQQLIVENIESGVLSIPPPLLSRSFQELATGMVQFHNAMKIAYIPFPFPYAQTCDCLLILHTMVVPFVTSQWVTNCLWAVLFTLIQVLVLWSLNLIALEIENPFGRDANDMDGQRMQEEINRHLLLLLKPSTERTPTLSRFFELKSPEELQNTSSFNAVLTSSRRYSTIPPGGSSLCLQDPGPGDPGLEAARAVGNEEMPQVGLEQDSGSACSSCPHHGGDPPLAERDRIALSRCNSLSSATLSRCGSIQEDPRCQGSFGQTCVCGRPLARPQSLQRKCNSRDSLGSSDVMVVQEEAGPAAAVTSATGSSPTDVQELEMLRAKLSAL